MPRAPVPHEVVVSRYGQPMTIEVPAATVDDAAARAFDGLRPEPQAVQVIGARKKT